MIYTPEQRLNISKQAAGKVIQSMEWDPVDSYWVIEFTDGSQICVLLMAELFSEKMLMEHWRRAVTRPA
jgi:hypothetical protein